MNLRKRAFTLMEVIIALILTSLVVLFCGMGLLSMLRIISQITTTSYSKQEFNLFVNAMRQDILRAEEIERHSNMLVLKIYNEDKVYYLFTPERTIRQTILRCDTFNITDVSLNRTNYMKGGVLISLTKNLNEESKSEQFFFKARENSQIVQVNIEEAERR